MNAESSMLVHLSEVKQALAKVETIEQAKEIRDKAKAIQDYCKAQRMGLENQNRCAEVKLWCERRLGEMLADTIRPGNPQLSHDTTIGRLPAGVTRDQSSHWQKIAAIPENMFVERIAETLDECKKELTTAGFLRLAKTLQQPGKQDVPEEDSGCEIADLEHLVKMERKFGTIYADPPWSYGNQGTRASTDNHYKTLDVAAIKAYPIADLAAEKSHLHLWTTNAFIRESFDIIDAWGFTYKSMFVWCKPQMGLGNYWRVSHEILLLGVRGQCSFEDKGLKSWAAIDRGEHSSKPEQVRLMIEKASPGPRLELFSRQAVPGWTVWGNQIEKDLFYQDATSAISS